MEHSEDGSPRPVSRPDLRAVMDRTLPNIGARVLINPSDPDPDPDKHFYECELIVYRDQPWPSGRGGYPQCTCRLIREADNDAEARNRAQAELRGYYGEG